MRIISRDNSIEENSIYFSSTHRNKNCSLRKASQKYLLSSNDIILHVEWLAIGGEQKHPQMKPLLFGNKSILNIEQQLYLSLIQSKNFNQEIWEFLHDDPIALNTILSPLIEWCRNNICECLTHSCRSQKRRQLAYYLTIIDCLLQNSSTTIDHYLHILSPIITNCLLYEFEVRENKIVNIYI